MASTNVGKDQLWDQGSFQNVYLDCWRCLSTNRLELIFKLEPVLEPGTLRAEQVLGQFLSEKQIRNIFGTFWKSDVVRKEVLIDVFLKTGIPKNMNIGKNKNLILVICLANLNNNSYHQMI